MDEQTVQLTRASHEPVPFHRPPDATLRDVFAIAFRQRRLMALCFAGIFLGTLLATFLLPRKYSSHMKILVKHERVDPKVTPEDGRNGAGLLGVTNVTEEELNSEVQLLKTQDLLEKVVVECGLQQRQPSVARRFFRWTSEASPEVTIYDATRELERELQVEPIRKTNLIEITYGSSDPQLSRRVLSELATFYLEKHLTVHRPPGAADFFQNESELYRQSLADEEARLLHFNRESGVVSGNAEKELTLQRLTESEFQRRQTQTLIAETFKRIDALQKQAALTPPRITAQVRTSENPQLIQNLKTTLLGLELKRTELLTKFEPHYRPVVEVEEEIAQTKAALAAEEMTPFREETTDRNPVYYWVDEELAKSKAELQALEARLEEQDRVVDAYREKALSLGQKEMEEQNLTRAVKLAEGNYLLYLSKREEARISDALDSKRIMNVGIAEAATVVPLPTDSHALLLLIGGIFAVAASAGSAFVADHFDPSLRTPDEVQLLLGIPLLAAVPGKNGDGKFTWEQTGEQES